MAEEEKVLIYNAWDVPSVLGQLTKLQTSLLLSPPDGDLEWALIAKGDSFILRFQDSDNEDEAICEINLQELEVDDTCIARFPYGIQGEGDQR